MCKQTHRILIYLGMFGKNLVFGFRLYIGVCAVTCNIWQASLHLFFRSHWTPVWACSFLSCNQIQSKDIKFKLKWHLYNICSGSIWNRTASVALLFQAFDYAEIKDKSKTASSLFTMRDLIWDRLHDCMWPGPDPNKEVHESVGGLLVSLSLRLEISTENICI